MFTVREHKNVGSPSKSSAVECYLMSCIHVKRRFVLLQSSHTWDRYSGEAPMNPVCICRARALVA